MEKVLRWMTRRTGWMRSVSLSPLSRQKRRCRLVSCTALPACSGVRGWGALRNELVWLP